MVRPGDCTAARLRQGRTAAAGKSLLHGVDQDFALGRAAKGLQVCGMRRLAAHVQRLVQVCRNAYAQCRRQLAVTHAGSSLEKRSCHTGAATRPQAPLQPPPAQASPLRPAGRERRHALAMQATPATPISPGKDRRLHTHPQQPPKAHWQRSAGACRWPSRPHSTRPGPQ